MIVKLTLGDKTFDVQADSVQETELENGVTRLFVYKDGSLIADDLVGQGDGTTYDSYEIQE